MDALISACVPFVAPATVAAVIQVESSGQLYALGINDDQITLPAALVGTPAVVGVAETLAAEGVSLDIGLMQVNTAHLDRFGVGVRQLFDPCTNLRIGGIILQENYRRASRLAGPGQTALAMALSAYNTGNFEDGFRNGYLARYGLTDRPRVAAHIYTAPMTVPHTNKEQTAMDHMKTDLIGTGAAGESDTTLAELAGAPGAELRVSPETADQLGALEDPALDEAAARASVIDVED